METIGYVEPEMIKDLLAPYNLPAETRVIDWGCGTGRVGQELQKLGLKDFTGLDFSEKSFDKCLSRGYAQTLPFCVGRDSLAEEL